MEKVSLNIESNKERLKRPKLIVIQDYIAQHEEELDLIKEDIIEFLGADDSGMLEGKNERTGKQGWFPLKCAEPLDDLSNSNKRILEKSLPIRKRAVTKLFGGLSGKVESESIIANKEKIKEKMANLIKERQSKSELIGKNVRKTRSEENVAPFLRVFVAHKSKQDGISGSKQDGLSFSSTQPVVEETDIVKKKNFLNSFLSRRLEKKSVVINNILKDSIYGVALEEVLQRDYEKGTVPFLQQCINYLEETGLFEEGLFRVNGSISEMDLIQKAFESKGTILEDQFSSHSVASSLKKFLREIPEPVIPFSQQEFFFEAYTIPDLTQKIIKFSELINNLSPANKTTLHYLTCFLSKLSKHSDKNKMTNSNLSIVFGPTIFREKTVNLFSGTQLTSVNIVEFFLSNYDEIFGQLIVPEVEKENLKGILVQINSEELTLKTILNEEHTITQVEEKLRKKFPGETHKLGLSIDNLFFDPTKTIGDYKNQIEKNGMILNFKLKAV